MSKALRHEHYHCVIEWWPGDEPHATWTVYFDNGTYRVLPPVPIGPFDNLAEVMRKSTEGVEEQLVLW